MDLLIGAKYAKAREEGAMRQRFYEKQLKPYFMRTSKLAILVPPRTGSYDHRFKWQGWIKENLPVFEWNGLKRWYEAGIEELLPAVLLCNETYEAMPPMSSGAKEYIEEKNHAL